MATVVTGSEIHFLRPEGTGPFKARVLNGVGFTNHDIVGKHLTVKRVESAKYELTIEDSTEHKGFQQAWAFKMYDKSSHTDFSLPKDGTFNSWVGYFRAIIAPPGCSCDAAVVLDGANGFVGIGTADIADIGGDDRERALQYRVRLNADTDGDNMDEANTIQLAVWSKYPDVLLVFSNTTVKVGSTTYEMKLRSTKGMDLDYRNPPA